MAAYHHMLVHFPLALWTAGVLIIILRAFQDTTFARACDRVLAPLLIVAAVGGILAYVSGILVWSYEAISESPLGRNHMLFATWTLAYWILIPVIRWRVGEAVWEGLGRWIMLGLALLGVGLLAVTGTLGGLLLGSATPLSDLLRLLGWEVYTTFYVPTWTLVLILAASLAMPAIAIQAYRKTPKARSGDHPRPARWTTLRSLRDHLPKGG